MYSNVYIRNLGLYCETKESILCVNVRFRSLSPYPLFLRSLVDANATKNTNINHVSVHSRLASLLREFPNIGAVNSSSYSKFAPTLGVEHHIVTDNTRPVRSCARPLFSTKKKAQNKLKAMMAAGIISRSEGSPWAAPLHFVKRQDGGWPPAAGTHAATLGD